MFYRQVEISECVAHITPDNDFAQRITAIRFGVVAAGQSQTLRRAEPVTTQTRRQ